MAAHCPHCGASIQETDAAYCAHCGKALNLGAQASASSAKPHLNVWRRDIGLWVACAVPVLVYASIAGYVWGGGSLGRNEVINGIFWPGIAFAVYWRKSGRSGWLGFGVGLVFGLCSLVVLSIFTALVRGA
jgi:hypothetical protein